MGCKGRAENPWEGKTHGTGFPNRWHKMGNCTLTCVGEMCLPKMRVPGKIKEGGGGK